MLPNGKSFIFVANQRCIDFVNTEIINQGQKVDLLGSFSDLLSWIVLAKTITPAQATRAANQWSNPRKVATLDAARSFRTMMREMVDQIARGKVVSAKVVNEINRRLRSVSVYPQVFRKGRGFEKRFVSDFMQPAHLLGALAESAAELLCNCNPSLIKRCKNPACILYFYDTTRNHLRNWCSMEICGNRMKVAAFYHRSPSLRSMSAKRMQTDH
jgi:predicted RNA-binding Zn ribbon-like protein